MSSFEFELLLLLMHRPNNRANGSTTEGNANNTSSSNNSGSGRLFSRSNRDLESMLSRPFPFATRHQIEDLDEDDNENEDNDDEEDDDNDEDDDDDDEDDDEHLYYDGYFESEENDSNVTASTLDNTFHSSTPPFEESISSPTNHNDSTSNHSDNTLVSQDET